MAQFRGGSAAAYRPELQEHGQVLVQLSLSLELELRHGAMRPCAMQKVEEVRHALSRRAEPAQPLVRPWCIAAPRELLQYRLAQEEADVQLVSVFADEQRLVGAGAGREIFADHAPDQIVARLSGLVDAMYGHQELLELRERVERAHCANRPLGTARTAGTPCSERSVAIRTLPVFIHFS